MWRTAARGGDDTPTRDDRIASTAAVREARLWFTGSAMNGVVQGADADRSIVTCIRALSTDMT